MTMCSNRAKNIGFSAVVLIVASLCLTLKAAEERVTFSNSIKPVPDAVVSRDIVNPDEKLSFMLSFKMRDLEGLARRIDAGEILTPAELNETYGPLPEDYAAAIAWAEAQGLTVSKSYDSRLGLFIEGKSSAVQKALQTTFAHVSSAGKTYTSAVTAPSLPASVASALVGVTGLQPHFVRKKHSHIATPAEVTESAARAVKKKDIKPPYTPPLLELAYGLTVKLPKKTPAYGTGEVIGIVIDSQPDAKDLKRFWSKSAVKQSLDNISVFNVGPTATIDTEGEATLDVEWASGIAPGAKVRIYSCGDLSDDAINAAYLQVIADAGNIAGLHQVSMSFGAPESTVTLDQINTENNVFMQMVALGVTPFASTGDGGADPSQDGHHHGGQIQTQSPCDNFYLTAVGGTSLFLFDKKGTLDAEIAWSESGGGISVFYGTPTFQSFITNGQNVGRLCPDVASAGDPQTGALVVLRGKNLQIGGTSWSAPAWAGFCAIINQARANAALTPLGRLNTRIYPLLGTSAFRDITVGFNGPPGFYNAQAGFDLCTGLGVPNLPVLITALTRPTAIVTPNAIAIPSAVSVGEPVTFTMSGAVNMAVGTTCHWDFGDGTQANGWATAKNFAVPGTYTTTLTITDGANVVTKLVDVTVSGE